MFTYLKLLVTNNAGVEDNESPKTLTKSAIFTTIDTEDEQLETLSTNLSTAQTSLKWTSKL